MADIKNKSNAPKRASQCETCEFYDWDEYLDAYVCDMKLDEDELLNFISGRENYCPYYRFYDEYKSVAKQN
ncbi:MAG: hypothetical protein E7675_04470 [Ruminococcaceae bacterium]|nr:hypothetical protein [Oscillospiraceae bacterium]